MTQNQHHMWPAANTQPTPMSTAPAPKPEQAPTEMATRAPMAITTPDSMVADLFGGPAVQIPTDAPLPQEEICRESQQFKSNSGVLSKELLGYILYYHECNTFWSRAFGESDGARPDCTSSDGIRPDGGEAPLPGPCRDCPNNQYESARDGGKGKACQNAIRLYLMLDGYCLPVIIKATAASLGRKESLIPWLTNAVNEGLAGKYQTIHVRLDLYKKKFEQFSASVLRITTLDVLDPQRDAEKLQQLGMMYAQVTAYHEKRAAVDVESTDRNVGETFDPNHQPHDGIPV